MKGKRGSVSKDFSHLACELKKMKQDSAKRSGLFIRIRIWFGGTKQACAVNTLKSLIGNMIIGVTEVSRLPLSNTLLAILGSIASLAVAMKGVFLVCSLT